MASNLAPVDLLAVGHLVTVVGAGYPGDDLAAIPTHDGISAILQAFRHFAAGLAVRPNAYDSFVVLGRIVDLPLDVFAVFRHRRDVDDKRAARIDLWGEDFRLDVILRFRLVGLVGIDRVIAHLEPVLLAKLLELAEARIVLMNMTYENVLDFVRHRFNFSQLNALVSPRKQLSAPTRYSPQRKHGKTMLPPILEIYVVWHPSDDIGKEIAEEFVQHFHGTVFSGLIGGAIEVYVRSAGWRSDGDAPRPIPLCHENPPDGIRVARFVAVIPLAGIHLAEALEEGTGAWYDYLESVMAAHNAAPKRVLVFPCVIDNGALDGTVLANKIGHVQRIAAGAATEGDTVKAMRCRDLAQGIAQLLSSSVNPRLRVFISHTKRNSPGEEKEDVEALVRDVRQAIAATRLQDYFDANDLQPGTDWATDLVENAKTSALLAVRTDLYPSRDWCQREMLTAKRAGMPVVIMDALSDSEERGSFLMDHVPRVATRLGGDGKWRKSDIYRTLNLLVDESLKRVVWEHQKNAAQQELNLDIAWWAPHAPEPITFAKWLQDTHQAGKLPKTNELLVLHPDPPLGPEEKSVLQELLSLGGLALQLDVMTPRLLAARSG